MLMKPNESDWERAALVCREVAELPDRTSSDLNADEMIVTADELAPIVADALAGARQDQVTPALQTVAGQIAAEIMEIMETYDSQMAAGGYVDTPGGLEHMGDVWSLLDKWRTAIGSSRG